MSKIPPPLEGIDFTSLPWNLNLPDEHVYIHMTTTTPEWTQDHLDNIESSFVYSYKDRKLPFTPATTSLNYGTTLWEGLKCYRLSSNDSNDTTVVDNNNKAVVVFRADQNYERMKQGAVELCLPMPSRELFLKAIQVAVQKNAHLIPPVGPGMKLYLRPMLLGSGQQLGLYPSPEFSFLVFVSPTGNYFKAATSGLNLHLETRRARAARGGMGSTKCAGNYAAALKPLMDCKKYGFHDNLFLELETYHTNGSSGSLADAVLQEMSAANIFFVMPSGEICTPALDRGTILPGVTRASVLAIIETFADELKPAVIESTGNPNAMVRASSRTVKVGEIDGSLDGAGAGAGAAVECFATGTAAELVPIQRLATNPEVGEEPFEANFTDNGPVTRAILKMLRECMAGTRTVPGEQWLRDPFSDDFCS